MELVYLWVEDYKNIKRQGFNFSPRFHCEFYDEYEKDEDGKEKLKANCKLEINPKEHIKNFFGKNINVTAIVGKNGSGKSSIIGILNEINILINKKKINYKLVFNLNEGKNYFSTFDIQTELDKFLPEYEYMSYNSENPYPYLEQTKYHLYHQEEDEDYEDYEDYDSYYRIDNVNDKIITFDKRQLLLKSINKSMLEMKVTSFMLIPYKYIITDFNLRALYKYIEEKLIRKRFEDQGFAFFLNDIEEYIEDLLVEREKSLLKTLLLLDFYLDKINIFSDFIIKFKDKYSQKDTFDEEEFFDDEDFFDTGLTKFIYFIDEYYSSYKDSFDSSFEEINLILYEKEFIISEISSKVKDKLFMNYADFMHLDFEDKQQRAFSDLSHGEKSIYGVMLNILYKIKNSNEDNFIFCLDEVDLSLHPEWQRKFLYDFLINIQEWNKNIHIILTTHSSFFISDIPKQNIIFLDKDEKGNCKVVDGLKEKKQTFGANIHTLLSDSFFMEDGLMGEFAKSKIDKAIKLLNKEHLTQNDLKYCEQIISIIGEPIVKNQLQRMLTDKKISYLAKDTREEIEFLKHRIDLLSKRL